MRKSASKALGWLMALFVAFAVFGAAEAGAAGRAAVGFGVAFDMHAINRILISASL